MADSRETRASRAQTGRSLPRQATSERINDILETARQRAETMDSDAMPTSRRQSSVRIQGNSDAEGPGEATGLVSRGSAQSYDGIEMNAGRTRSRKSIYSRPRQGEPPMSAEQQQQSRRGNGPGEGMGADTDADADADADVDAEPPRWKRLLGRFKSIELENKGSVARDHLALDTQKADSGANTERTFLAWLRTSLAFASIGIAVTQLFRLNTSLSKPDADDDVNSHTLRRMGKPLGTTFLGISIVTLLLGARRYFVAQAWVLKGKFPASRGTIVVISLVALAIMLVSLAVVIVIHPSEDEL